MQAAGASSLARATRRTLSVRYGIVLLLVLDSPLSAPVLVYAVTAKYHVPLARLLIV